VASYPQDRGFFRFNKGIYLLRKEDVNLKFTVEGKKPYTPTPELYFIEGHPIPLGKTDDSEEFIDVPGPDGKTTKVKNITKASAFLDKLVISNALMEVGKPRGLIWEVVADYVKKPFNVFILVIAFIVLVSFLVNLELPI
jgi:hypothetical protein